MKRDERRALPMHDVQGHYDRLLALHYSWTVGRPLAEKAAEQKALLEDLGVRPGVLAVDLGCGPGYQALALSDLGFREVIAVDTSPRLLEELEVARDERRIHATVADMRELGKLVAPGSVDTISCMGDTLTHLDSWAAVEGLLNTCRDALRAGGKLVLTFRDYSTALTGLDRFIPIRADEQRIMVCALDYGEDSVIVSDLLHIRTGDSWGFHKSSYRKLRLAPPDVIALLEKLGFAIEVERPAGEMYAVVAGAPA